MEDQAAKVAYLIRVMRIAFFVSGILFIYVMIRIPSHAEASPTPALEWALVIVSLVCVAVGFLAPRLLARAIRAQGSQSPNPLQKQFTLVIFSLAFFEAATLFGFVLHLLGADVMFVRIAVSAGMISQLVWSPPSLPSSEDENLFGPR